MTKHLAIGFSILTIGVLSSIGCFLGLLQSTKLQSSFFVVALIVGFFGIGKIPSCMIKEDKYYYAVAYINAGMWLMVFTYIFRTFQTQ